MDIDRGFAHRFVTSLLRLFAHEGSFDVDLRSEAERKEVTIAFEERGCEIINFENRCRVTVTVPPHLMLQGAAGLPVADGHEVQEAA